MSRRGNGEGSLKHDVKNRRWIWCGKFDDSDKKKYFTAKTKKAVLAKVDEYKASMDRRKNFNNMTLCEWSEIWLAAVEGTVKPKTYEYYYKFFCNYINDAMGNKLLGDIKSLDIQYFLNNLATKPALKGKPLSPATVNGVRRTINACLNYAVDNDIIRSNPAKSTKPIRNTKRQEIMVLSKEQLMMLLDVAAQKDYIHITGAQYKEDIGQAYLRCCYYFALVLEAASGLRIGELFALTWSDLDLDAQVVHVKQTMVWGSADVKFVSPKTLRSKRDIDIDDCTVQKLKKWQIWQKQYAAQFESLFLNSDGLVFTNSFGKPINYTNFYQRYWRKLLLAAELPEGFTFHALRHTHASLLLMAGENIKVVSERLGHSSVSTTYNIYCHVVPNLQKHAAQKYKDLNILGDREIDVLFDS